MFKRIKKTFNIKKEKKRRLIIVLIFFLVSFAIAHFYSLHFTKYVYIEGYHIHHFYFGMISLFLGGILAILNNNSQKKLKIASALIGIGIGMFADEFGLLLNCTTTGHLCTYAFPDPYDIILTIALIIIFLIISIDNDVSIKENFKRILKKVK